MTRPGDKVSCLAHEPTFMNYVLGPTFTVILLNVYFKKGNTINIHINIANPHELPIR